MAIIDGVTDAHREETQWPPQKNKMPVKEYTAELAAKLDELNQSLLDEGLSGPYKMRVVGFLPWAATGRIDLRVEATSPEEDKRIRRLRDRLADEALGFRAPDHDAYEFHISIVYLLRHMDDSEREELETGLQELLAPFLPLEFELDVLELCFFDDVCDYWHQTYVANKPPPTPPVQTAEEAKVEDEKHRRIHPSLDAHRLRWIVKDIPIEGRIDENDPMSDRAIEVIADALDQNSPKTPYKSDDGKLHPIHASSIAIVPRKELTITIPDMKNYIHYDECPEDHPDFNEETGEISYDEPKCEIKASNGEFVTIGDYIEAVYPWLISLRERYVEQAPVPGYYFGEGLQLWVNPSTVLDDLELFEYDPSTDSDDEEIKQNKDDFLEATWEHVATISQHRKETWPDLEQDDFRFHTSE